MLVKKKTNETEQKKSRPEKIVCCNLRYTARKRELHHTRKAAIENANTIEERRSKIVRNRVFECHLSPHWRQWQSKTQFLSIFDPHLSIVDNVFDYCLPGVCIQVTKFIF